MVVDGPQPPRIKPGVPIEDVKSTILALHEQTKSKTGESLGLLIVLLPDANDLYGEVKRVCETSIGLISQCCLQRNVVKKDPRYLTNVALKINVKAGGRNMFLVDPVTRQIPFVTDMVTIVFGADVTHPPGEPSIAAVVASMDWPEISKYAGVVRAQTWGRETIEHQDEMIKELLRRFYSSTGKRKPKRIIFYRDGVSEGQFDEISRCELDAIRKAWASLEGNHGESVPPITFVVVQKRHHTRLFPKDYPSDPKGNANVPPGTVVDRQICHPNEFDFYLCSHVGIQGTSRPAHYHVLWDENRFTADRLQKLTNDLCYTYARSTTAVSYVPPAYYAHLAAFRARFYLPRGTLADPVPQLPPLHENIKSRMFYC